MPLAYGWTAAKMHGEAADVTVRVFSHCSKFYAVVLVHIHTRVQYVRRHEELQKGSVHGNVPGLSVDEESRVLALWKKSVTGFCGDKWK